MRSNEFKRAAFNNASNHSGLNRVRGSIHSGHIPPLFVEIGQGILLKTTEEINDQ